MLITGHDPMQAYAAMVRGAFGGRNAANFAATLNRAVPIVGMGLAAALAFRAGFFNIGGEGQLVLGGIVAAVVALNLPLPGWLVVPLAALSAAGVGGAYAWLAAFLDFRFRMPMLISTLLMIYPARLLASYLVSHPLRDAASGLTQTLRIASDATLPKLAGTRLSSGLIVVLLLVATAHWLILRTRFGYRMRMTGLNARFSRYGGVDVERLGYRVMFLSGATAGLVGAVQVLGVHYRYIDGSLTSPLYAWIGIMVALLAGSRPLGVLLAGLFFAAVQTGGFGMERATDVPREISQVLQALIILLVAARSRFQFGNSEGSGEAT
jgi:simple sugar transport system permease protein